MNAWPFLLAGVTAADPQPSLRREVVRPIIMTHAIRQPQCVGECPTHSDRADGLARLLNGWSSTSTTQWEFGSSGPYTVGISR